jgi:hypothetical protein
MYLTDAEGHELLDAFAGLWCVNVGYGQESIVAAASEQMRRLPYATGYFSFASEPAIRLAERLADLSPPGLDRVYFTLGGSDAVDSAIRFIVHYFNATGRPAKKHMIALDKGYHGSSSNGAGLTGLPAFHRQFDVPHRWQHHIPAPYPYRSPVGEDPQAVIDLSVAQLKAKVEELGAENVAAFLPSRFRDRRASSCRPKAGSRPSAKPAASWTFCSSPMRSSPALAAPARCSPARARGDARSYDPRQGADSRLCSDGGGADERTNLCRNGRWA